MCLWLSKCITISSRTQKLRRVLEKNTHFIKSIIFIVKNLKSPLKTAEWSEKSQFSRIKKKCGRQSSFIPKWYFKTNACEICIAASDF